MREADIDELVGVGDYFPMNGPRPWPVKFAEKYLLPGPEQDPAVFDEKSERPAGEQRHYMGGRIALCVLIVKVSGNDVLQSFDDIPADIGIGSLVDGESSGGMRVEQIHNPGGNRLTSHDMLYFTGDIDQLHSGGGGYFQMADSHLLSFLSQSTGCLIVWLQVFSRIGITYFLQRLQGDSIGSFAESVNR